MKKSCLLACGLVLLAVPDLAMGQPSGVLGARPEHLRGAAEMAGTLLFRLAPANAKYGPPDAAPADGGHWLSFYEPERVGDFNWDAKHPEGVAFFSGSTGYVAIYLGPLVPGRRYLLSASVFVSGDTVLALRSLHCSINFNVQGQGSASFDILAGPNLLNAVVEKPVGVDVCTFRLGPNLALAGARPDWRFYYVELRELQQ